MQCKYFLENSAIGLRSLGESDLAEEYFQWLNDDEITRFIDPGFFPNNWKSFRTFYESLKDCPNNIFLGIFWKKNGEHIGNVKLGPINWIHRYAPYSIVIGNKDYWGKGVCTEVTSLVCHHAFESLNLNRVHLGVVDKNISAVKAYEKIGFKVEGVSKKYFWANNEYHDNINMALLREEYIAAKKAPNNSKED